METKNKQILVVDDHAVTLMATVAALSNCGYDIDQARGSVEALEMATAKRYDLILMDFNMPVWNGCECTKQIRNLTGGSSLSKIIGYTACVDKDIHTICLNAGMNDYLDKDASVSDLQAMVSRWCSIHN